MTKRVICLCMVLLAVCSCVSIRKQVDRSGARSNVSQVAKKRIPTNPNPQKTAGQNVTIVKKDSVTTYITDVEIEQDGEKISVVNIEGIVVTSTLKSIPERFGMISIDFVVSVPQKLQKEQWCIMLTPVLHQLDTVIRLDPVVLRGETMDLLQRRQLWQRSKYQTKIDHATQAIEDTVLKKLTMYNNRQQFFREKEVRYNSAIYEKRVDFFNNISRRNAALYGRRSKSFTGGADREDQYLSFFSKKPSPDVTARMDNSLARRESQALTAQQVMQRYGRSEGTTQRLNAHLAKAEARSRSFVTYPQVAHARLDSLITTPGNINYLYSQDIKTDEHTSRMTMTLDGKVENFRGHKSLLPPSDTLTYTIASMINFIDHTPRYVYKIIEKYATVNDRSWISFPLGKSKLIDSLADNRAELEKMTKLMHSLLYQYEFYVDSIMITAASSPDGNSRRNDILSKERAHSLQNYLVKAFNKDIDTILKVRWVGEDWSRLQSLIKADSRIENNSQILNIIAQTKDPDRRAQLIYKKYPADFKIIKEQLYPQLRAVSFKYALRRVGMIQDTVYTTELDSAYMKGIVALEKRKYSEALRILEPYKDVNSAITLMSLGYDKAALEIMETAPQTSGRDYMLAILCARCGDIPKGLRYFEMACKSEPALEYRANLDPEIQILIRNRQK